MATREPSLTPGMEEECLLVDRETGAVASERPEEVSVGLNAGPKVARSARFLRPPVEVVAETACF